MQYLRNAAREAVSKMGKWHARMQGAVRTKVLKDFFHDYKDILRDGSGNIRLLQADSHRVLPHGQGDLLKTPGE